MPVRGLVSWGALVLFGAGTDGHLGCLRQLAPNGNFSDWESFGVPIRSAPAAAQNGDGRLEAFAVAADGRLGHVWQNSSGIRSPWADWTSLEVEITGDPVVFQNSSGHLEVFAAGPSGRLGHMWQREMGGVGGWTPWMDLGPEIGSVPSVFRNADGRLEVFALDTEGQLGHVWQQDAHGNRGWAQWDSFGHALRSPPVVFQTAEERLEVFAIGPDGCLGHVWQFEPGGAAGWSDWGSFGHVLRSPPAVFQNADGRLEVFAIGDNGRLGHVWQLTTGGTWSDWDSFEQIITTTPTVFPNADGCLEVFALDAGARLGRFRQLDRGAEHGWSQWMELDASVSDVRLAACQTGAQVDVDLGVLAEVQLRANSTWPAADSTVLRADVCVVGGGPAGITLSRRLIEAGASVILLESGHWGESEAAQELNHGDAYGPILKGYLKYLRHGRRRQIQGAAAGWGKGWCMPFRAIDYEPRPWVRYSGWPVTGAELAPYEELAAATLGLDPFTEPVDEGPLVRLAYRYPPDPLVFRRMFLQLLTRPGFRAELGATALELATDGDRIASVRVARQPGDELRVEADSFVLAAGGIENARLLLLNQDALPAPLPMAGRFFMEHPHCLAGSVLLRKREELRTYLIGDRQLDVLALADTALREEGLVNASVQLRPVGGGGYGAGPVNCELFVRAEQAPNPDSYVTLGDRRDRLGQPSPELHWELLEQDWTSVVRTVQLVAFTLEKLHNASFNLLISDEAPWPWSPASPADSANNTWGYHHMGTTRMAADPAEGVVDVNSLVHGTANLFVAGSSVFPTGSCANPTFQIVALAHRLAEHLSSRR